MSSSVYLVDNLTLRSWVFHVLPHLLRERHRISNGRASCLVVNGRIWSLAAAKATAWIGRASIEKLNFSIVDLHDRSGLFIVDRIESIDMWELQQLSAAENSFQEVVGQASGMDLLPMYLAKKITPYDYFNRLGMWQPMVLVHLAGKIVREKRTVDAAPTLFLEKRPWFGAIERYASKYSVSVRPLPTTPNLLAAVRRRLPTRAVNLLRLLRDRGPLSALPHLVGLTSFGTSAGKDRMSANELESVHPDQDGQKPRVGVEFMGQLNLDHPQHHSNLLFWKCSSLPGSDVLVTFSSSRFPLNEKTWPELHKNGIAGVATYPGATTLPLAPSFVAPDRRETSRIDEVLARTNGAEGQWLSSHVRDYERLRHYWSNLFSEYGVKVYVTYLKEDAEHCAVTDALHDVGGVSTVYQRSFELHPSPAFTTGADILFSYSLDLSEIERRSNSVIRYYVATGYLGDHRFNSLRGQASRIRESLNRGGAERIAAYFDENSADDSRWHQGNHVTQENYAFLLEKLLSNPSFGLVLKPKVPRTLRRRLGPVTELLERALASGRCYVFEDGVDRGQGVYPPAAAALAADVAVHGHLGAGTAGMEAALAGVPTLLLDREGSLLSPLCSLPKGQVVFNDWDSLWDASNQHWNNPSGLPGFGDWSLMLDDFDPFRDGHAAQRMGAYIQSLLEGFQAGLDRDTVMADAADRYTKAWGSDKVQESGFGTAEFKASMLGQ